MITYIKKKNVDFTLLLQTHAIIEKIIAFINKMCLYISEIFK